MVKTKNKLFTILALFLVLIIMTGLGAYKGRPVTSINEVGQLKGKTLGGVATRMPENSSKIFFESLLGVKLGGYKGYQDLDSAICALKTGRTDALWCTDVTAAYLKALMPELKSLPTESMSALQNTKQPRFSFGLAVPNNKEGQSLKAELDTALLQLEAADMLPQLREKYIYGAAAADKYPLSEAISAGAIYKQLLDNPRCLKVGITGAVAPVELIDEDGEPYGFCVALCDDLAILLGVTLEMVVLDNETAMTQLMSGRVDALLCYGTGVDTVESSEKWLVTRGYLDMHNYEVLVMGGKDE